MFRILLLLFSNFGLIFSNSICTLEDKKKVNQNIVPCALREFAISIERPSDLVNIWPELALVKKCVGSCWMTKNTCRAIESKNTSVAIKGINSMGYEICTQLNVIGKYWGKKTNKN